MIWLLKSIFLRYREHNGCQGWFMDRCHTIENWGSAAKPRHLSCQVDIYAKSMHYRYRCIVSIFHLYIFQIHQHKYLSCNSIPWSSGCQSLFHVENSWWFTFWWHCRWGLVGALVGFIATDDELMREEQNNPFDPIFSLENLSKFLNIISSESFPWNQIVLFFLKSWFGCASGD